MLGAIAGDIAGSPWEGGCCPPREFTLFGEDCTFTDDTVCTIAVADALLSNLDMAESLRDWVRRYPGRGYGGMFVDWARTPGAKPYGSYGNGGAMRVASVGWLAQTVDECLRLAELSAAVSHNHPEGVKGAQAVAIAIWLARNGMPVRDIRRELPKYVDYDLTPSVADLRRGPGASVLAQESVPVALVAALESKSWLEAVKNTASIGGDVDTTSCMAGGIAEALYGLPHRIAWQSLAFLPPDMVAVVEQLYARANKARPWDASASSRIWPKWLLSWRSSGGDVAP